MTICKAVVTRINQLLQEKNMTLYRLEQNACILHGTMMCIMKERNKNVTLKTIFQIAYGFNMSVIDFLNDDVFKQENLEIF